MKKILFNTSSSTFTYESLFRTNFGRLSYFAFQFVKDKAIAEDFVQDAFAAYWDRKQVISDHPNAIKDFLYTSVRNSCLNHLKRQKVQQRYFSLKNEEFFENEKVLEKMIEAEVMAKYQASFQKMEELKKPESFSGRIIARFKAFFRISNPGSSKLWTNAKVGEGNSTLEITIGDKT